MEEHVRTSEKDELYYAKPLCVEGEPFMGFVFLTLLGGNQWKVVRSRFREK